MPPMKLPKSNEEWMEANQFFETMLVPAVIATSSPCRIREELHSG